MSAYLITATATLDAASDEAAQAVLDAIARVMADGDGEYGYDWQIEAEPIKLGGHRSQGVATCVECPECGAEVDTRTARSL